MTCLQLHENAAGLQQSPAPSPRSPRFVPPSHPQHYQGFSGGHPGGGMHPQGFSPRMQQHPMMQQQHYQQHPNMQHIRVSV